MGTQWIVIVVNVGTIWHSMIENSNILLPDASAQQAHKLILVTQNRTHHYTWHAGRDSDCGLHAVRSNQLVDAYLYQDA